MRVAEVVLDVPVSSRAAAEAAAYSLGAQGLELRDGVRGRVSVVFWLPASMTKRRIDRATATVPSALVRVRSVAADWEPPRAPSAIERRYGIDVESSLTFGDGRHATTALCVRALEHAIRARRVDTLLDVGTGSGILAIVAGKLGVTDIVATDIDPLAREAARRALRKNAVHARVQTALPRRVFDCVVANLYFEPLVALAGELAARVSDDGTLIVSGFTRANEVEEAFAAAGLRVRRRRTRETWCCFEFVGGTPRGGPTM